MKLQDQRPESKRKTIKNNMQATTVLVCVSSGAHTQNMLDKKRKENLTSCTRKIHRAQTWPS